MLKLLQKAWSGWSTDHVQWGPIDPENIDEVLQIERQGFPDPWTKREFRCTLRVPTHRGFVCMKNYAIMGYCVFAYQMPHVEILNLAVLQDQRRLRIGTAILMACEIVAAQNGARYLRATVTERNLGAQLFLRARGFECDAWEDSFYDDGQAAYFFAKGL